MIFFLQIANLFSQQFIECFILDDKFNDAIKIFLISILCIYQYLFIYYFIFCCAGSSLLRGLFFSCGKWGLLSSCGVRGSHCSGFSCGSQAVATLAQLVVSLGLAVPLHVGSSQTWNQTCILSMGRWILNQWTTREILMMPF